MRKAIAIVALTILAACGGSDAGGEDTGWGAQAREEFIAGCESGGAPNAVCVCMQEKLEAEYPDAEDPADFEEAKMTEFTEACTRS